jgi:DMSO/TMAO reductase YedYZ molybdopterin-dependent catalytic subunit
MVAAMRPHLLAVLVMLAAALSQPALAQAPVPAAVTTVLAIKGSVENELVLSIDDLKRLPVQHIEDVRMVRDPSSVATTPETARHYAGCLLRDVLDRAKPIERKRFDLRKSVVVATASDGYRAVFSWAELYLSPIGDGALVVYERDGVPLSDNEGPLALVSLKDTRPGPRHVKWLRSIELRTLAD